MQTEDNRKESARDVPVKSVWSRFRGAVALILIGGYSLGAAMFSSPFAEIHVDLPFLNFPVFLGELFLGACALLWLIDWWRDGHRLTRAGMLWGVWMLFVLGKALSGYLEWGPLALRHAALFYYSLFAGIAYYFFSPEFFRHPKVRFPLLVLFILAPRTGFFYAYMALTFVLLALVTARSIKEYRLRRVMYALTLLFAPYELLFHTSRTFVLANSVGFVAVAAGVLLVLSKRVSLRARCFIGMALLILWGGGLWTMMDRNAAVSMLNVDKVMREFYRYDKEIAASLDSYQPRSLPVALYFPQKEAIREQREYEMRLAAEAMMKASSGQSDQSTDVLDDSAVLSSMAISAPAPTSSDRDLFTAVNNILFRLFIWRDMIKVYVTNPSMLGFDFGNPVRSPSLEILGWAREWERDGWITAHNSYLQAIYNSGIAGVVALIVLFMRIAALFSVSVRYDLLNGIMLGAILVNWLVAAGFLVILELPYNAIPFWALMGVATAYVGKYKSGSGDESIVHT